MLQELDGKVAVITGGGSGIGASLARACAAVGMRVVVVDVNEERAASVAAELPDGTAVARAVDVSDADAVQALADFAFDTFGAVHLLCNNAEKPKPGNTQHCDRKAKQEMVVQAVAGHMHLLGRSIKVELNPGTKKAKTLLNVPVYDFDNQGARMLKKPVTVEPGDTLRVTCTHDATLRSQLPSLKTLQPRYVLWGEGTSDEMCLGVVIWSAKAAV